jgi:CHAD domain-containing protein
MTTQRPVEVELKYRVVSDVAAERLLNADVIGTFAVDGPIRTVEFEDRYVDTKDGALGRAGYAARLRRERGSTIISIKSQSSASGSLQRRIEMEGPADRSLSPAEWPTSAARSFILEHCGDAPLLEVVTVRQTRRKRAFRDGDTVIELSLDDVEVIARTQLVDRFTELEFELTRGPEEPLLALGRELDGDPDLAPSRTSKFQAALAASKRKRGGRGHAGRDAAAGLGEDGATGGTTKADRNRDEDRASNTAVAGADTNAGANAEGLADGDGERRRAGGGESAAADERGESRDAADRDATGAEGGADHAPATETSSEREGGRERRGRRSTDAAAAASAGLTVGKTPGITTDDVVAEAGRKVLRFHLARLIAREAGTRSGDDPEELHSMRVATRRMRAAWRVFGDGFRQDGTKRFRNRLRDVARKLGAVRDIDVLILALEEYRAALPEGERKALEPLLADWRAERDAARDVLVRELDSDGYRQFVDDYRVFVLTPGAGSRNVSPTQPNHVRDTAGSRIWLAYEQVVAYGPVLRWADVPTLHQLRIAGKWLRYTLEFVAEGLGPDAQLLIARVVAMQDHLGLMNDAEVAALKARTLLVARSGSLSHAETTAIARYLTSQEREVARLKRGAPAPWRALASASYRGRLGRALARLAATSDASHPL